MDELRIKRAHRLLQAGLDAVAVGNLRLARERFRASAELNGSADAFTYWGWMEHRLGNTSLAIELCQRAIAHDPDFGNPYNDIGSYLYGMGDLDGAIPWLEKAVSAKRYEPRHYPHINLGRIYLAKQMPKRALVEFEQALEHCPDQPEIEKTVEQIRQSIN
jgi:tetratricopeptide (TPR) repeat protein